MIKIIHETKIICNLFCFLRLGNRFRPRLWFGSINFYKLRFSNNWSVDYNSKNWHNWFWFFRFGFRFHQINRYSGSDAGIARSSLRACGIATLRLGRADVPLRRRTRSRPMLTATILLVVLPPNPAPLLRQTHLASPAPCTPPCRSANTKLVVARPPTRWPHAAAPPPCYHYSA